MIIEFGELLPLALLIAISPLPVTGVLLALMSSGGGRSGAGFSIGWLAGIALALAASTAAAWFLPAIDEADADSPYGFAPLGIGVILTVLGIVKLSRRPAPDAPVKVPRWISAVDNLTPGRAVLFGLILAISPKKIVLAIAAGLVIGRVHHSSGLTILVIVIFSIIASFTVLVPLVLYLRGGDRTKDVLERIREWTIRNLTMITNIALLVLGVILVIVGVIRL